MTLTRIFMLALVLAVGAVPTIAASQINPTLTEAERGIRKDGEGNAVHLRIDELRLDAHIVGRTAEVTLEMLIGSDRPDPFEGNLALALPADAVVTGYALDVGGRMIPGQLLESPKARNVYEDEVREGIDPGLAEVSGNRFTTRIFPIDNAHPRRFRLSFVAAFDPVMGIVLPLARDAAIGSLAATISADGFSTPPIITFAGEPMMLSRDAARWIGRVQAKQAVLRDGLTIKGGVPAGPITVARHASGEAFFIVDDEQEGAPKPVARGGRLRIYWDRSVSHRDARPELEVEVLARLIDTMGPSAIDLVTFASDRPSFVTVANAAALRSTIERIAYRGGTSFRGLDMLPLPDAAHCVLVSDGQVTIDKGTSFAPDCRLMVLAGAPAADGARLGRIAQRSAGAVVRVVENGIEQAVAALAADPSRITGVWDAAGQRVGVRALPAAPGRWLIVGRMPRAGEVRVRLRDGSERRYAPGTAIVTADAPGALWAVQRVADLADDPSRHAAMVAMARRYRVAGPGMSFLVLERPDQYLRASLTPAGFSADWMEQYRTAKAEDDQTRAEAKRERFAFVVEQWRERRAWWAQRFTPSPSRYRQEKRRRDGAQPDDMEPPPPPPPAEPPLAEQAAPPAPTSAQIVSADASAGGGAAADDAVGELIVTGMRREQPERASIQRPQDNRAIGLDLPDLLADRPYLAALNAAAPGARLAVLADQERAYGVVPSFYLDVAEWFRLKGMRAVADLLLLSALDLPTSDDETRQIVAFRLERDGHHDRAVELAEHLAAANAEFRPQPGRDLALALAALGRGRGAAGRADLERAFALLTEVALNPASSDFDGMEVVALTEANALIPAITAAGGTWSLDRRLVGLLDTDARIVIGWTADDADIDLWVDEPNGERVYYGDKLSSAGGQISNDMTDGYGPEEYAIRRAPPGAYRVRINGYDADRINPNGPGHVLIRLYRNFARPGMQQVMVDADLSFQADGERDREEKAKPVATLRVGQ